MNLPNKLCFLRLFLVLFVLLILYSTVENRVYIATFLFIIAAITDVLDGYIARSRNLITDFGKFFDPLVDKILVISVLVYLVYIRIVPDWMVIIIIVREFAVSGFRIIAASKGIVVAASKLGKFKTQSQVIAVIVALLKIQHDIPYYQWILLIAVVLTVVSGIDYIWKGKDVFKE